ncbi:HAD family hydrolase [Desulfurivibrio alkaliphilus]|uniref:HAD-superfamily hydrolase, subfamily IIB n=1 Tax=Desulfurivibrio alkaliphilus (strain DSM 19089 / UNIQEM U267 / AHT2) TaxID=589865 RepID=D6Z467_DESAT|nr:HAD family hydrolase [Desulfurivibrio alkaliphilus]ADH86342.1 HAD-superfamily hydrolase, subfamily IIB [Desulfurivibrio alkaliphilus AHT 2]
MTAMCSGQEELVGASGGAILLCSDLDRTILPNGAQPESSQARPLLHALARRPEVTLAYVSGRHRDLLAAAVAEYGIPLPDYAIGDVGTTIYRVGARGWQEWLAWHEEISADWQGLDSRELAGLLEPVLAHRPGVRLQEPEKQNRCKLSYYTPAQWPSATAPGPGPSRHHSAAEVAGGIADQDREELLALIGARLEQAGLRARLVWSVDEERNLGLLDVLPATAGKLAAIRFLMRQLGFARHNTVFSGDSGNDLDVLTSELNTVLVANAPPEVRAEALARVKKAGRPQTLYCAAGGFMGMNGNYAAGVLEGVAHFQPQVARWLT